MTNTSKAKTKPKDAHIIDSKPAQLAKIMYVGLLRLKEAKESLNSGRNSQKRLDFNREQRVNVNGDFD